MRLSTTILGGLPVEIEYSVARAEPDVGIMSDYVEEWWVEKVKGRTTSAAFAKALQRRVEETKGEDALLEEIMEHYND